MSVSSPSRCAFGYPREAKRATRFTAAALVVWHYQHDGLVLFPMDGRATVGSQRDTAHTVATILMSIFIVATMAFGLSHMGRFQSLTPGTPSWRCDRRRIDIARHNHRRAQRSLVRRSSLWDPIDA
jgi:hypothetical protein